MSSDTLVMSGGEASLPSDFGRVSYEGYLIGPNGGSPWVEISWQDMTYLRARTLDQSKRLYAVGSVLQIPNVGNNDSFTLAYQTVAPTVADAGSAIGFPAVFGEALLLGTVMKLKEEEGDQRQIWRVDYQSAIARAASVWSKTSRPTRMPMTVGGMW
jgi:hypothetical protein